MRASNVSSSFNSDAPSRWGQYRHLFLLWLLFFATSLATRIMLAAISLHAGQVAYAQLPYAFATGLMFDALTGLYLCLPFAFWIWLMPTRWYTSRVGRGIVYFGFAAAAFGLLYLIAAEYFFFEEFNSRFNYTAVEYLIYPTEVIGNIRDSYPVDAVLGACAFAALLITWLLRRRIREGFARPVRLGKRSVIMLVLAVIAAISIWAVSLESVQSLSSNRSQTRSPQTGSIRSSARCAMRASTTSATTRRCLKRRQSRVCANCCSNRTRDGSRHPMRPAIRLRVRWITQISARHAN